MTATPPTDDRPLDAEPRPADGDTRGRPDCVLAVVEEYDDAPAECTLYPDAANRDVLTEWITAEGDGFVPLAEMR